MSNFGFGMLITVLLSFPSIGLAQAAAPVSMSTIKPYMEVPTVVGDQQTVRVFFSPNCAFSQDYFQFFKNLSLTLPNTLRFIYSPVVNVRDGKSFAIGFLAVQRYYPEYVFNFVEASMIAVQEKRWDLGWNNIDRIGKAAQLPVMVSSIVNENRETLDDDLRKLFETQKQLRITNTPSVAVAGTYVVTPEITYGDSSLFSELVNGIISMAL